MSAFGDINVKPRRVCFWHLTEIESAPIDVRYRSSRVPAAGVFRDPGVCERRDGLRQQQIVPLKQKRPNFVQPLKRN
jgi:hypothetical protein